MAEADHFGLRTGLLMNSQATLIRVLPLCNQTPIEPRAVDTVGKSYGMINPSRMA